MVLWLSIIIYISHSVELPYSVLKDNAWHS